MNRSALGSGKDYKTRDKAIRAALEEHKRRTGTLMTLCGLSKEEASKKAAEDMRLNAVKRERKRLERKKKREENMEEEWLEQRRENDRRFREIEKEREVL